MSKQRPAKERKRTRNTNELHRTHCQNEFKICLETDIYRMTIFLFHRQPEIFSFPAQPFTELSHLFSLMNFQISFHPAIAMVFLFNFSFTYDLFK